MLFNSLHFVVFFIIVTCLYFALPHKYRWMLLLSSSCYFYMVYIPVYILILGFTIIIGYLSGIQIEKSEGKKRRIFLIVNLVANIGVLAFFKYYNFINETLTTLLQGIGFNNPIPYLSIILPIGLSFHTFKAMSYSIDVYRGEQPAEKHLGIYALYEMFYPILVAGPIERPQNLLTQLHQKHKYNYSEVSGGLKLMLWGLFMKVVIADRLALYVNAVYNNYEYHSGISLLLATVFFTFQIYCDFAGYSYIAKGSAQVMGFKLMNNFNTPFLSKTISEFWNRWHISLSSWFRDYLFLPLATTFSNKMTREKYWIKKEILIYIVPILITFIISGLWHGANWTFVIWGALHGLYLAFAALTKKLKKKGINLVRLNKLSKLYGSIQILTTFLLVAFAFIFFRANNIYDASSIVKRIFSFGGSLFVPSWPTLIYSFFGVFFLVLIELKREYFKGRFLFFNNKNWLIRNLTFAIMLILIILLGNFDGSQFIYFQF